ncbi:MAG: alginate lyase family protein [Variibacter sp.]|nr:alginate lyase family protein [Variibacter sp.]
MEIAASTENVTEASGRQTVAAIGAEALHPLARLARLWRTVRHLRARQIVNRVSRRFTFRIPPAAPAPPLRPPQGSWRNCPGRPPSMVSPSRFRFLGQEAEVVGAEDWNAPGLPKLWLYNLHYFDDLRADGAPDRAAWHRALIARWIAENPAGHGNGWEPYPLSLRIVNWIGWALAGHPLEAEALESLARQVRTLLGALEFHLMGNHLFANAKALVIAGCFFSGREADRWRDVGLKLLEAELDEQILADGGHFELSPMYHATILEDVLDLIQTARLFPGQLDGHVRRWQEIAFRMLDWLAAMTHPDGEIAFFNDAATGIARRLADLRRYAALLDVPAPADRAGMRHLAASGYVRLESGPWCAIFDVAEIGPSYIPGHGHADVLSFELSLGAERLVTNSGTSSYAVGPVRRAERATAAHATVEIDGQNSSEVWESFRVGRRAHPFDVVVEEGAAVAAASHDGYRWLPGRPVHRREIAMSAAQVRVRDCVTGGGRHHVVGRLPLHPSVRVAGVEPDGWRLEAPSGRVIRVRVKGPVERFTEQGHYAPAFGARVSRPVLAWRHDGPLSLSVETLFEL